MSNSKINVVGFILEFDRDYVTLECFFDGEKLQPKSVILKRSTITGFGYPKLSIDKAFLLTFDAKKSNVLSIKDGLGQINIKNYFSKSKINNLFDYTAFKPQIS